MRSSWRARGGAFVALLTAATTATLVATTPADAAPAGTPAGAIAASAAQLTVTPGTDAQITGTLTPSTSDAKVYFQLIAGGDKATSGGVHACTVASGSFTCDDTYTATPGADDTVRVFADNDGNGTFTSGTDVSTNVEVIVSGATVPATGVTASGPAAGVNPGTTATITGTLTPASATVAVNFSVSGANSGTGTCAVSSGAISCDDTFTANPGTDTVRVFADNAGSGAFVNGDPFADVHVTVNGGTQPGTSITAGPATQTVVPGGTAAINGTVTPANSYPVYYYVLAGPNKTTTKGTACTVTAGAVSCKDTDTAGVGTDTVRVFVDENLDGKWENGDIFADVTVKEAVLPLKVALTPATSATTVNTCSGAYTSTVTDSAGSPVGGVSVTVSGSEPISTASGTLSMCTPAVTGTAGTKGGLLGIGKKPSNVTTNVTTGTDGTAAVTFVSDTIGTASIKASVTGGASATATLTISAGGAAAVAKLTASPATQQAKSGDTVKFTITATTSAGAPVGGVAVQGKLNTGSASGTAAVTCGTTSTSSPAGQVACSYKAGNTSGTDTLTFWVDEAGGTAGQPDSGEPQTTATVTVTAPTAASQYVALTPFRILDTRTGAGNLVTPGAVLTANKPFTYHFQASPTLNVARAVALNVTAIHPSGAGNLRLYAACPGATLPNTSLINYQTNADIANFVVMEKPSCGITFYSDGSTTGLAVDLEGYFTDGIEGPAADPTNPPVRLVDTRTLGAPLSAGSSVPLQVAGTASVPAGASAVLVNVTAVNPRGVGNLRVYPDGGSVPTTSNINYIPHVDKAVFAIVQLPTDGKLDFYSDGSATDVVVDVYGYLDSATTAKTCGWGSAAGTCSASTAVLATPVRAIDTRPTGIAANTPFDVTIAGANGVPADAQAVLISLTAIQPAAGVGNLAAYPSGSTRPTVSNINYVGKTADVANFAIVALGSNGKITLYSDGSAVNAAVDILGYIPAGATS